MARAILALDIGGANIKVANGFEYAVSYPFPLWRQSQQLGEQLRAILQNAPRCDLLAITMTGELADCYLSKTEGVKEILTGVKAAAGHRELAVYLTDGRFVSPSQANEQPLLAAASNWHALANYCGRLAPRGSAIMLDIGSTTTDIIPLRDGRPVACGSTDTTRLVAGELVYTGVQRSPLCAVVPTVPYRGRRVMVAQELFATTYDAYLWLRLLPEAPQDCLTADNRAATRAAAKVRLGRLLAADETEFNDADAQGIAEEVLHQQITAIVDALNRVAARLSAPLATYLISGQGEFLAAHVLSQRSPSMPVLRLGQHLGERNSLCAPAHALAVLAREALA